MKKAAIWIAFLTAAWISTRLTAAEISIEPPKDAVAYKFGTLIIPGLKNVTPQAVYTEQSGFGFVSSEGIAVGGGAWPDPLSGSFASSAKEMEFRAKVPNGTYRVWLCAGKIIRAEMQDRHYLLKLNGTVLCDETPTDEEFIGEKYLCRFMWTQYSEKPHALWENYIDPMYPSSVHTVKVTDGVLVLNASNYMLAALIAAPEEQKAPFEEMTASIRTKRIEVFEKSLKPFTHAKPEQKTGDGPVLVYAPLDGMQVKPWSSPSDEERKRTKISEAGAPGQRVSMVLALTPFADQGKATLALADLKGPGTIPAANIKGHFKNWRYTGSGEEKSFVEMALLPSLTLNLEAGLTQTYWLWLTVPQDASPGVYKGVFKLSTEKGFAADVPVEFEVYPFKLEDNLPVSYGMWGTGYTPPFLPKDARRKMLKDRFEWMREIGFTGVDVDPPEVKGIKDGVVDVYINPETYELAKETGMGRRPEQMMLNAGVMAGSGRKIGSLLPGSRTVYKNPGIELKQPEFKKLFMQVLDQYREFLEKMKLPVAVTSVDEPRERAINSWNRNLADTIVYSDMVREAKLTGCCDPMYDTTHGKDYTPLIDHVDVLSTHAWKNSEKFMTQTLQKKKILWLYNTGQDRYSWGFYNWRSKSNGRWEWHFCWSEDGTTGGYPGREWYNPFVFAHATATSLAPSKYKGGLLYVSRFLGMSEGVTDYAYLYTLEQVLKSDAAAKHPKEAEAARTFLAALERAMPQFPEVKGLASAADGPAVGMGIEDDARTHVGEWRKTIAKFLIEIKP